MSGSIHPSDKPRQAGNVAGQAFPESIAGSLAPPPLSRFPGALDPSVRPTAAFDPRVSLGPQSFWVARIGAAAIGGVLTFSGFVRTLGALGALRSVSPSAAQVERRVTFEQLFESGFRSLFLVGTIAAMIGATVTLQAQVIAPSAPPEFLGTVLAALVIRELAPLVTALVITARSGAAIATELGTMSIRDEIAALVAMGVDPTRYVIRPRLLGVTTSVVVLSIYFVVLAIIAGGLTAALTGTDPESWAWGLRGALKPTDLVVFLTKGLGLGLIISVISCHFGLAARVVSTDVPENTSRAIVASLLVCLAFNTVVTAAYYSLVGSPFLP